IRRRRTARAARRSGIEEELMTRICPKCGSQRVHRSQRRGAAEHLLSFSGLRSRRCHECNTRFLTLGGSTLFRSDLDRLLRKATVVALAAIALVAVVTIVVWLSRREAATAAANGVELYRPGGGRPIVWQEANVLYRSRQWRSFMAASRGGGHGNAFLSAQGIDV